MGLRFDLQGSAREGYSIIGYRNQMTWEDPITRQDLNHFTLSGTAFLAPTTLWDPGFTDRDITDQMGVYVGARHR